VYGAQGLHWEPSEILQKTKLRDAGCPHVTDSGSKIHFILHGLDLILHFPSQCPVFYDSHLVAHGAQSPIFLRKCSHSNRFT
jgi:hypothetical protein